MTLQGTEPPASAGRDWVMRYLWPLLTQRLGAGSRRLRCLQLLADDDDEADQLRRLGHDCTVLLPAAATAGAGPWHQAPQRADLAQGLPCPDGAVDFGFSAGFTRVARGAAERAALARELARVLAPGGAWLLAVGNRRCPFALPDRESLLHGPAHPTKAGLDEMEAWLQAAGFSRVERLGLAGQFGWGRLPRAVRPLGRLLDAYLAWASRPERRARYGGPLNTVLMLWVQR